MIIHATFPQKHANQISYVLEVMLGEFLGVPYRAEPNDTDAIRFVCDGRELVVKNTFWSDITTDAWKRHIPPSGSLQSWNSAQFRESLPLTHRHVPVLFGEPVIDASENRVYMGIDVFGSAFFMLSRIEETTSDEVDFLGRFPVGASLAYRHGFLLRPIVDEYVEILWACMSYLWPGLQRRKHCFRMLVSCDVDLPYSCGTKSMVLQVRQLGADILLRGSPKRAIYNMRNFVYARSGDYRFDPYYPMIDWMMDVTESTGHKIAFNFIAGHSDERYDGCYDIGEPSIRALIKRIHTRGHEIGLHPSFLTYLDPPRLKAEADRLREVMAEEKVAQPFIGGRQHYLRWRTPMTARAWDSADLAYDSTLGYAAHTGFRCGTCREFPLFDIERNAVLSVRERPLIAMEATVLSKDAMALKGREAQQHLASLKQTCRLLEGDFTLLWHNSNFFESYKKEIFLSLL